MENRKMKVNFWNNYEEELKLSLKENSKKRIRELFAHAYIDYLDFVLTPLENFGIKDERLSSLSFTEKFYLILNKIEKADDFMNFPYPRHSYDCEVFKHIANELCSLLDKNVSSMLLTEKHYWYMAISKDLENIINNCFCEIGVKSEKVKEFMKAYPTFSFPPINMEKKDRYWSKVLISSFTDLPEWIWCLVGNIKESHEYGEEHEIRQGSKHFSGGTKIYCFPSHWGDGYENIHVMGKPRKSRNLIMIVLKRELIENFRLKQIYDKRVIEEMYCGGWHGWDNTEESKQNIEQMVSWLNNCDS